MPSPAGSFLYTRSSAANTQPNISTKEMLPSHCRARLIDAQLFLLDLTHEADEVFMRRVKGRRQWRIITAIVRYHICIRTRARTKLERKKTPEVMVFSRSHILLAACGSSERAYECTECNSGYFTTALLRVFRSNEMHMLKYKRCFEEFPRIHIYPTRCVLLLKSSELQVKLLQAFKVPFAKETLPWPIDPFLLPQHQFPHGVVPRLLYWSMMGGIN
jgi:hypothetical protein